jgi:DNA-binding IclR family transcriptional regulator
VPAVERAIAILPLLARSEVPLEWQAIARELSFDPQAKRYRLDAGILSIARGVLGRMSFNQLVRPALNRDHSDR